MHPLLAWLIQPAFKNTMTRLDAIFAGTILSFFSGVPQPCIRAEMSKLVNKEEQGMLAQSISVSQLIGLLNSECIDQ